MEKYIKKDNKNKHNVIASLIDVALNKEISYDYKNPQLDNILWEIFLNWFLEKFAFSKAINITVKNIGDNNDRLFIFNISGINYYVHYSTT
jgi:hypothetical protein